MRYSSPLGDADRSAANVEQVTAFVKPRPIMLWLYLARQIVAPFGVGLTILVSSLSLERLLRLIDMVVADGAPASRALLLMLYLIPHYFSLALPAAFFLAVLMAFRGLQEHFELAIVQAAGISLRHLLPPVLLIATVIMAVMLLLSGYIEPYARYDYRAEVYRLSAAGQMLNLQPGVFTGIGKHMTARAEEVSDQGQRMQSVFVTEIVSDLDANTPNNNIVIKGKKKPNSKLGKNNIASTDEDATTTYAAAPTARVERDKDSGQVTLVLENGNLIRTRPGVAPQLLSFKEYPWTMEGRPGKIYGARGRNEREMTFQELIAGGVPNVTKDSTRDQELTELHTRLVQAISVPFLALLALPLALIGGGRTGKAYGIAAGIIALILYDKILGFGHASAARGRMSPWLAEWVPLLILIIAGQWTLRWKAPLRLKTPQAEKAQAL